jgi:hypothetical protein
MVVVVAGRQLMPGARAVTVGLAAAQVAAPCSAGTGRCVVSCIRLDDDSGMDGIHDRPGPDGPNETGQPAASPHQLPTPASTSPPVPPGYGKLPASPRLPGSSPLSSRVPSPDRHRSGTDAGREGTDLPDTGGQGTDAAPTARQHQESGQQQDWQGILGRANDKLGEALDLIEQAEPQWRKVAAETALADDHLAEARSFIYLAQGAVSSALDEDVDQRPDSLLKALANASTAKAQTEEAEEAAKSSNAGGWLIKILKGANAKIKSAIIWLWNAISGLLTPKSWTVTGGLAVPGLAQATISINFG